MKVFVEIIRTKQSCQDSWTLPSTEIPHTYWYSNTFIWIPFSMLLSYFFIWEDFFPCGYSSLFFFLKHWCYLIKINKMFLIQSKDISLTLSRIEVLTFDLVIFFFFLSAHRRHSNIMVWKFLVYIGVNGQNVEELSVR